MGPRHLPGLGVVAGPATAPARLQGDAVARLSPCLRRTGLPPPPGSARPPSDAPRATVTPGAKAPQGPERAVFPATPLAPRLVRPRAPGEPPLRPIARTTGRCLDEGRRSGEDAGGWADGEKGTRGFFVSRRERRRGSGGWGVSVRATRLELSPVRGGRMAHRKCVLRGSPPVDAEASPGARTSG